jgi:peroxiredoxin
MKNITRVLIITLLMSLGWTAQSSNAQFYFMMENPRVGDKTPEFQLKGLDGKEQAFQDYRSEKSVILFFWATWCPYCRVQLEVLNKKRTDFESQGIRVAAIDLGEDAQTVKSYLEKNKITLPVFLDEKEIISESFALIGVPTFVYIDQKGIVQSVEHELLENYEEVLLGK